MCTCTSICAIATLSRIESHHTYPYIHILYRYAKQFDLDDEGNNNKNKAKKKTNDIVQNTCACMLTVCLCTYRKPRFCSLPSEFIRRLLKKIFFSVIKSNSLLFIQ